jgi:3-deoxy-D-manno-octulosonic-acid transferase
MLPMSIGMDLLYAATAAVSAPVWGYNLLRTGKWRTDWAGRLGNPTIPPRRHPSTKRLLIHTVSVGETNLVRLLVEMLERDAPDVDVVISATTNTGIDRAKQLYGAKHAVVRYPLDFSCAVAWFLDAVQPDAVALVENEVWPNFVEACERRRIPTCVINGRLTERSHKRYAMLRPIVRRMYGRLTAAAVQTPDYAARFVDLGAPEAAVHVFDTMKWDTAQIADHVDGAESLAAEMGIDRSGGRPLIVAGSTGPGEEKLLIDTCPRDAQLMLVPRKPERFDEVAALDPTMARRTRPRTPEQSSRIFLLDTIGELRKAYALADVCLVGRSFLGLYGSDVMEPVALGKPTVIGPHHADFADAVAALRNAGGLIVTDAPGRAVAELLADRAHAAELARRGVEVIRTRQGATHRHADLLLRLLNERRP